MSGAHLYIAVIISLAIIFSGTTSTGLLWFRALQVSIFGLNLCLLWPSLAALFLFCKLHRITGARFKLATWPAGSARQRLPAPAHTPPPHDLSDYFHLLS